MPSHRAGPDTWVTAHILLELLKSYQPETLIEISRQPVTLLKIGFGKHRGMRFSELPWEYLDFIVNKSDMRNDSSKEDVVHTAKLELARRATKASTGRPAEPAAENPDAWRGRF